jgi:hypothetical protein
VLKYSIFRYLLFVYRYAIIYTSNGDSLRPIKPFNPVLYSHENQKHVPVSRCPLCGNHVHLMHRTRSVRPQPAGWRSAGWTPPDASRTVCRWSSIWSTVRSSTRISLRSKPDPLRPVGAATRISLRSKPPHLRPVETSTRGTLQQQPSDVLNPHRLTRPKTPDILYRTWRIFYLHKDIIPSLHLQISPYSQETRYSTKYSTSSHKT